MSNDRKTINGTREAEVPNDGLGHAASQPAGITRRDAVRLLGVLPLLEALDWSGADVERAARMVRSLAGSPAQSYQPRFFTADEWSSLNVLVDYIIPRDAKSGSATDARVPEFIDFMLTDSEQNVSQNARNLWRNGIEWLNGESVKRFGQTFVAATDAQRRLILDDIAWPARAPAGLAEGVTFFNRARDMTAAGFFSSEIGWKDLEYMGNIPVPVWNGCPEPALQKLGVSYDLMNTRVPARNGG